MININSMKKSIRFSRKIEIKEKEKDISNNYNDKHKTSKRNFSSNKKIKEQKKQSYIFLKTDTDIKNKTRGKIKQNNDLRYTINFKNENNNEKNEKNKEFNNNSIQKKNNLRNIKKISKNTDKKINNSSMERKKDKNKDQSKNIKPYRTINIPKENKKTKSKKYISIIHKNNTNNTNYTNKINKIKINSNNNNDIIYIRSNRKNREESAKNRIKFNNRIDKNNNNKINKMGLFNTNNKIEKNRNNKSVELRPKLKSILKNKQVNHNIKKIDIGKKNENILNTEILKKAEKIKKDKNHIYKGPLDIKNLIVVDSIEYIHEKISKSLHLNQIKYWKLNPLKYSCCAKNMDKFCIQICFISEVKVYKDSSIKNKYFDDSDDSNILEIKYLFYIKILLSKESNDIPNCKLLEKVINNIIS